MKFLLDQDVYGVTAKFLETSGYNFIRVSEYSIFCLHKFILFKYLTK